MSAALGLFRYAAHRADLTWDRVMHAESWSDTDSRQRTPGTPASSVTPCAGEAGHHSP